MSPKKGNTVGSPLFTEDPVTTAPPRASAEAAISCVQGFVRCDGVSFRQFLIDGKSCERHNTPGTYP